MSVSHAIKPTDWIRVGFAMFTIGFGANLFAPMLQVYRVEHAAGEASLTGMLGIYSVGLIPSLLVFGTYSDQRGRRPVLVPGLAVAILGSLVLSLGALGWNWPLFIGRIIIGVSVGMGMSAGAAWIKQLSNDKPGSGPRRATVSVSAGFGLGPLASGLVAQFAPLPELIPYLVHIALTALALALVWRVPETQERTTVSRRLVPHAVFTRRFLFSIVIWAPWVFGVTTTAFASTPGMAHLNFPWVTAFLGFLACITMLAGVFIQPTAARIARSGGRLSLAAVGLLVTLVGLLLSVGASLTGSLILMSIAAIVLGAAYGIMMVAGLSEAESFAAPSELGGLIGIFYSLTYLGFFVPLVTALVVGVLSRVTGMSELHSYVAVLLFGVVVCLVSVVPVSRAGRAGQGTAD
ncbi:MFS transporter [Corynebacterium doosanense]|uniref:MFS transporter n=1 Tax=Corynebacterium doosanense CAU 212 = DSM 45436 TaxID=558173 RepID=A0A097III9_9CORY|nr:MFS transporter [Corynebacterium doosanense]AIT61931.1 MFS transporter [Corynebacterium doosanense CAU 212 = DSM 45436]